MRNFRMLLLVVLLPFLPACAAKNPVGSYVGEPLPDNGAIALIAQDATTSLTEMYPPGHTTLSLLGTENTNTFGEYFENSLREKGFTIAPSPEGINIAYVLDAIDEKSAWYLQLKLSDSKNFARVYSASGQPEGGKSQILDAGNSALTIRRVFE